MRGEDGITVHRALLPSAALAALIGLAACEGPQSALAPGGREAKLVADLFWVMLAGAAAIWSAVMAIAVYAARTDPKRHNGRVPDALIIGGGVVFPLVTLTALLSYGLFLMPQLRAENGGLRLTVSGEQWWWRVAYEREPGAKAIVGANEIRLPVGERVEILAESPDVIHAFWIPSLGGKIDMIPGRVNRFVLEATEPGIYRGVCAEYCGDSHALMAFTAVAMEPDAFAAWLRHIEAPAQEPRSAQAVEGRRLFLESGCGSCHAIRGTPADGMIGPDLTHVGGRESLAAGILPNTVDALRRWIAYPKRVKPGAKMPSFAMLPEAEIEAIAVYLNGLE